MVRRERPRRPLRRPRAARPVSRGGRAISAEKEALSRPAHGLSLGRKARLSMHKQRLRLPVYPMLLHLRKTQPRAPPFRRQFLRPERSTGATKSDGARPDTAAVK